MSAPAVRDLACTAGDDYSHRVTITDGAGTPTDVSARSFAAQIRARATDEDPAAEFDIDATDASDGVLVLTLASTYTTAMAGVWLWSLRQTSDPEATILAGEFRVGRATTT